MNLADTIRDIPDFPKKGIVFKDITTLLNNKDALRESIDQLAELFKEEKIDYIVGTESRGFIFGTPLAYKLGIGFVPVRKPGKLPGKTLSKSYDLEYGTDTLEIHKDAIPSGANVLIIDDLIATGGTIAATVELVEELGAKVAGLGFVIELGFLKGREKLAGYNVQSLINYQGE